jgi:hypothetical protein
MIYTIIIIILEKIKTKVHDFFSNRMDIGKKDTDSTGKYLAEKYTG